MTSELVKYPLRSMSATFIMKHLATIHAHPPFTPFEHNILRDLYEAPTQLHPNSSAFIRAFQIILDLLDRSLSMPLFYSMFTFVRVKTMGWVSFRASGQSYFSLYTDSCKSFKVHYACVVTKNSATKKRLFVRSSPCSRTNVIIISVLLIFLLPLIVWMLRIRRL